MLQLNWPTIQPFLQEAIGGGVGVFVLMEVAKRVNAIPLSAGQTGKLRAAAGGLSLLATILIGAADHKLQPESLSQLLLGLLTFGGTWVASHGLHKGNKALSTSGLLGSGKSE